TVASSGSVPGLKVAVSCSTPSEPATDLTYIRSSTPVIASSSGVATVSEITLGLAPGYTLRTTTEGGTTSGYSPIGSSGIEIRPAAKITIDSTAAKIGRSMKKRENSIGVCPCGTGRGRRARGLGEVPVRRSSPGEGAGRPPAGWAGEARKLLHEAPPLSQWRGPPPFSLPTKGRTGSLSPSPSSGGLQWCCLRHHRHAVGGLCRRLHRHLRRRHRHARHEHLLQAVDDHRVGWLQARLHHAQAIGHAPEHHVAALRGVVLAQHVD